MRLVKLVNFNGKIPEKYLPEPLLKIKLKKFMVYQCWADLNLTEK